MGHAAVRMICFKPVNQPMKSMQDSQRIETACPAVFLPDQGGTNIGDEAAGCGQHKKQGMSKNQYCRCEYQRARCQFNNRRHSFFKNCPGRGDKSVRQTIKQKMQRQGADTQHRHYSKFPGSGTDHNGCKQAGRNYMSCGCHINNLCEYCRIPALQRATIQNVRSGNLTLNAISSHLLFNGGIDLAGIKRCTPGYSL